MAIKKQAPFYS